MTLELLMAPNDDASPLDDHLAERLVRLNVEQYCRMVETGILTEGAPIELIDGLLVYKDRRDGEGDIMVVGPRHRQAVSLLQYLLMKLTAGHALVVLIQQPLNLSPEENPEPDLAVIQGSVSDFSDGPIGPEVVQLVIEVADSSLAYDRGVKQEIYATAGIPTFWIINLRDNQIEVHTDPEPGAGQYRQITVLHPGEQLPWTQPDGTTVTIAVNNLLP